MHICTFPSSLAVGSIMFNLDRDSANNGTALDRYEIVKPSVLFYDIIFYYRISNDTNVLNGRLQGTVRKIHLEFDIQKLQLGITPDNETSWKEFTYPPSLQIVNYTVGSKLNERYGGRIYSTW